MLHHLHIKNCFTHADRRVEFAAGLTCITGPNEIGKSLLLEMVAYALFGAVALRGSRPDGLFVELGFAVKGVPYRVTRQGAKALLLRDGAELATGTKPVNAAIVRVLGYDHTVYGMANLCAQGQIEALGAMKPAERKKAVDQTIGLSVLDEITKWCGDQALGFTREADTLERLLVKPIPPEPPEGAPVTAAMVAAAEADERERIELLAWIRNEPTVPPEPVAPGAESATTLQSLVDERQQLALQVASLKTQADAIPDAAMTEDEIAQAEAGWTAFHRAQEKARALVGLVEPTLTEAEIAAGLTAWAAFHRSEEKRKALAGLVEPTMTRADCDQLLAQWDAHDLWIQRQKLAEHLSQCPKCGHEWADDAAWDRVKDAPETARPACHPDLRVIDAWEASADLRAEYADVPDAPKPDVPELTYQKAQLALTAWTDSADLRAQFAAVPDTPMPGVTEAALRLARNALAEAARKAALVTAMTGIAARFVALPDRAADLAARRRYDADHAAWAVAVQRHGVWRMERVAKDLRLDALGDTGTTLVQLRDAHQRWAIFEREVAAFEKAEAQYEQGAANLKTARETAEYWSNAKKAVADLRVRVKAYLLPSLNKVASLLIGQMTGGKRTSILVDEDFDIRVDGQPVNTLSGSGKAVANLSLRVALGLVLTNRVFSVFMGDELDASMDKDRAGCTAEALARLTETVGQVIVVSHKPFDADNNIDLGVSA